MSVQLLSLVHMEHLAQTSVYLPDIDSFQANTLPEDFGQSPVWALKHEVFLELQRQIAQPQVALFGLATNHKVGFFLMCLDTMEAGSLDPVPVGLHGYVSTA